MHAAEGEVRRHPDPDDHDFAGARGSGGAYGEPAVARVREDLQRVGNAEVRAASPGGGAGMRLRRGGGGAASVPGAGVGRGGRHAGGRVRQGGQGGPGVRRPVLVCDREMTRSGFRVGKCTDFTPWNKAWHDDGSYVGSCSCYKDSYSGLGCGSQSVSL